ncbi:response regulator [Hydrogenophaga sp.]|uniref:response regulator n=1 Tax=Hydrogenophaga sp. TaxID=1904254 RepID=UPI0035B27731
MTTSAPHRFILIDDSEADNLFHKIMIQRAGFGGEILIFEDSKKALNFLRTDAEPVPTCILLDINMPVLNGFELAEEATPLLKGKPTMVVVMLTSSHSPEDKARAQSIEIIQGYVSKPLTVALVRQMLHPS